MLAVSRVRGIWYAAVVGKVSSPVLGSNRAAGCAVGEVLTIEPAGLKPFVTFWLCKALDTLASFNTLELFFVSFPFLSCMSCREKVMISWDAPCLRDSAP